MNKSQKEALVFHHAGQAYRVTPNGGVVHTAYCARKDGMGLHLTRYEAEHLYSGKKLVFLGPFGY